MPDKLTDVTDNNVGKITDSEIVKAYEDKVNLIGSMTSVYLDEEDGLDLYEVMSNALDLINRLQAEKEELVGNIDKLKAELFNKTEQLKTAKAEAYEEFAEW